MVAASNCWEGCVLALGQMSNANGLLAYQCVMFACNTECTQDMQHVTCSIAKGVLLAGGRYLLQPVFCDLSAKGLSPCINNASSLSHKAATDILSSSRALPQLCPAALTSSTACRNEYKKVSSRDANQGQLNELGTCRILLASPKDCSLASSL